MATGESTFSSAGRTVKKFESKPLPIDVPYDFKVNSDWEKRCRDGAGNLPYLNGSFELLNTASAEGGKNRRVYAMLFLNMTPDKDGVVSVDRGNGLVALSQALGVELSGIKMIPKTKGEGEDAKEVMILSPNAVLEWLKSLDGATGKLMLKNEKDDKGNVRNKVDFFIAAEEGGETEEAGDEGGDEESEEQGEDEADEEDEAPPAKKPAAKPAPAKGKGKK